MTIIRPTNPDEAHKAFRILFYEGLKTWDVVQDPDELRARVDPYLSPFLEGIRGIAYSGGSFHHESLNNAYEKIAEAWKNLKTGDSLLLPFSEYLSAIWLISRLDERKGRPTPPQDVKQYETLPYTLNLMRYYIDPQLGIDRNISSDRLAEVLIWISHCLEREGTKTLVHKKLETLKGQIQQAIDQGRPNDDWRTCFHQASGLLVLIISDTL